MPYIQPWVDPNTGAVFPQSYVRVISAQADHNSHQGSVQVGRWASIATYSLGLQPVQRFDMNLTGSAYIANFAGPVDSARGGYDNQLQTAADTYVGAQATFSGAQIGL